MWDKNKLLERFKVQYNNNSDGTPDFQLLEDLFSFVEEEKQAEEFLNETDLLEMLHGLYYARLMPLYCQEVLLTFIKSYQPKRILDPFSKLGFILNLVSTIDSVEFCKGYTELQSEKAIVDFLNFGHSIVQSTDLLDTLQKEKEKFDLVISQQPLNYKKRHQKLTLRTYDEEVMAASSQCLNDNGKIIFFSTNSFVESESRKSLIKNLDKYGLELEAFIDFPPAVIYRPLSRIKVSMVVLSKVANKRNPPKVFLASVSESEKERKVMYQSYFKKFDAKKSKRNGYWVNFENIASLDTIIRQDAIRLLLKDTGLPLFKLNDLGSFKRESLSKNEQNNCLIIPAIYTKEVTNYSSKYNKASKIYYNFIVDSNKVSKTYLKNLLNTDLGIELRKSAGRGSVMSYGSIKLLSNIMIPVPLAQEQNKILELDHQIQTQIQFFTALNKELWAKSSKHEEVERKVNKVLKDPSSAEWIETLPYPIASILWSYYSETSTEIKVKYLLCFFEALTEFQSVLLLSSFIEGKNYIFSEIKETLANIDYPSWQERTTFGSWCYLRDNLVKEIDKFLTGKEISRNIQGNPSDGFLKSVKDGKWKVILEQTNTSRNHISHAGHVSKREYIDLLNDLEDKLGGIKNVLLDSSSYFTLIRAIPESTGWDDENNVFSTKCEILKGTRSKFNQETIKTSKPIAPNKIYFIHNNQLEPVKLLPLIYIGTEEESNACYFYNKLQGKKAKFISYYFENQTEIRIDKSKIEEALYFLNPIDE